ncbi:MAG: hypothetical protein PHD61_13335 [Bacteroidales bacterium]|nr:hypothetical protein [Bacteroidales bacterium]
MRTLTIMKRRLFGTKLIVSIALLFSGFSLIAQGPSQVDLGIFLSSTPDNQVEIRMRPTYDIISSDLLSEIKYTIYWTEPSITVTPGPGIAPFNMAPLPSPYIGPVLIDGKYYFTFDSQTGLPVGTTILAGTEVVIATFTATTGVAANIYLVNDEETDANNWDYFFEIGGSDRTGIFYQDTVEITPDAVVPLANWPIYLAVLLMVGSVAVLVRKFR